MESGSVAQSMRREDMTRPWPSSPRWPKTRLPKVTRMANTRVQNSSVFTLAKQPAPL